MFTTRYELSLCLYSCASVLDFKRHAIAEAVNRRPLTAQERVQSHVSPCVISDGQSGIRTGFSAQALRFSTVSIIPLMFVYSLLSPDGETSDAWSPSKKQCYSGSLGALDRKAHRHFLILQKGQLLLGQFFK